MLSGNKGEWSEIYALLKLISDKQLFVGDSDLKKIEELFYPIIKIIRCESGGNFEYELKGNLVFISDGIEKIKIPIQSFRDNAIILLQKIKSAKSTFRLPELQNFLDSISCHSLKAKSTKKTDIIIEIHDLRINQQIKLGFSIKSQLGSDSTLLNAGRTTNFIYEIQGFKPTSVEINRINNIDTKSKIKDRIEDIRKHGGNLKFHSLEQAIFNNNLVLIDSLLPNILSEILRSFFSSSLNTIEELTSDANLKNPLNYDNQFAHTFYEYKLKRFLTDVALGMMPSKVWGGTYDATGGYLIVKENGEILCYHIYNKNEFENYLFYNTKLETASSTRHGFGKIYKEEEKYYFNLNLQIRFL